MQPALSFFMWLNPIHPSSSLTRDILREPFPDFTQLKDPWLYMLITPYVPHPMALIVFNYKNQCPKEEPVCLLHDCTPVSNTYFSAWP